MLLRSSGPLCFPTVPGRWLKGPRIIEAQQASAELPHIQHGYRSRPYGEAMEHVQWHPYEVGDDGSDHVRMGEYDDGALGVSRRDAFDGCHGPALHLAQGFAVGEAHGAGRKTHHRPLFLLR